MNICTKEAWQISFLEVRIVIVNKRFHLDFMLIAVLLDCSEDANANANAMPLSSDLRLKIAIGAARGLAFLHSLKKKIICRDFKSSNIMLDEVGGSSCVCNSLQLLYKVPCVVLYLYYRTTMQNYQILA